MLRAVVVIGLSAIYIGLTVPNVWLPLYDTGMGVNGQYDLVGVQPGSGAQAAGLRDGDHIEPASLSPGDRMDLSMGYVLVPGKTLRFVLDRGTEHRTITMRTALTVAPSDAVIVLIKRGTSMLFILVAAMLLLLRPSAMLWGFFFFALSSDAAAPFVLELTSAPAMIAGLVLLTVNFCILGPIGLLMFTTRFPLPSVSGWRAAVARAIPLIWVLLFAYAIEYFIPIGLGIALPSWLIGIGQGIYTLVVTLGITTLLAGFMRLEAPHRQRLRWVVAGFAVYYAAVIYALFLAQYLPDQGWPPAWSNAGWTSDVLLASVVFIPLTVAYAVLKHHVLDINFVLGRGLVYGIVTSIAVAIFAVIDWLLGTVLARTQLAVAGEVMAAIAIGFWLNGLHRGVDRFVDAVIFRRRHLAEVNLSRVTAGLSHAETDETVSAMLVQEPVEAFGLMSAALFRRRTEGAFTCERAFGPAEFAGVVLATDDRLAVHLYGARGPVLLHNIGWKIPGTLDTGSDPIIAFPIFVRHELAAIVLYGAHQTGEAFDPDETKTLESLCVAAAAAFDHIEAAQLRRRLDEAERALQIRMLRDGDIVAASPTA